jgi:uncharacterized protein YegL
VKALFLITDGDGQSKVWSSPKKAANILKNYVEIFVIGIGEKVRDAESLRQLASKDDNVFSIKSYKHLNKVTNMIVSMPVKGKQDYHLKTDKIS